MDFSRKYLKHLEMVGKAEIQLGGVWGWLISDWKGTRIAGTHLAIIVYTVSLLNQLLTYAVLRPCKILSSCSILAETLLRQM